MGKISTYIQYLAKHALTRGGGRKNTAKKRKKNQSASSTNWRSLHPSSCNEVCPLRVNQASTKLWADSKRLKPTAATVHLPLLSCIPTCSMELYEEFFGYVDHTVHEVLSVHAFDDDEEWRRSTYNWRRISIRKEELLYSCIVMRWDNSKKKIAALRTNTNQIINVATTVCFRACLHGGGGPQVGEVTRLGGVTHLSI